VSTAMEVLATINARSAPIRIVTTVILSEVEGSLRTAQVPSSCMRRGLPQSSPTVCVLDLRRADGRARRGHAQPTARSGRWHGHRRPPVPRLAPPRCGMSPDRSRTAAIIVSGPTVRPRRTRWLSHHPARRGMRPSSQTRGRNLLSGLFTAVAGDDDAAVRERSGEHPAARWAQAAAPGGRR